MIDKTHPRKYLNEALGLDQAKTDFGGEISNVRKYGSLLGKFRFGLLGVLSLLQKGQTKTSIWITAATEIMNLLQLLSFSFNVKTGFPWTDWVEDKFVPILQAANLSMLSSGTSNLTLTMFLASVCFVAATFGVVAYVGYSFATDGVKQLWLLPPLRLALDLLTTVLYVPALDSLLQIYQCQEKLSDSFSCGGTVHIIMSTVVAILTLIFMTISGMAVLIIIERSPAFGDVGAKAHGRLHALSLGLRGLMSFTFVAIGSDNPTILVVQIVLSAFVLCFAYFYYLPYYSMLLNKVSMAVYGTFFFSTLCLVLEMLLYTETDDRYGAFMAFAVGAPLCWFTCDSLIGARMRKLKHTPVSAVESPIIAELIMRMNYPMPQTPWEKCRNEYLDLVGKAFPKSAYLAIHVATLLRDCGKDTLRSERLLQKCKTLELNFDERFVVFKHQLDAETARSTGMEGGGAINFMAFDNHINQAQQTVLQAMENIVSVLRHLKSGSHNQEELLRLAYKMRRASDNASFHLEQLMRITNDSAVVFRLYSLYLEFVINDKFMASALMDQAVALEEEAERTQGAGLSNLKNSIHGTMTISGEETSLGIIRSVSPNLCKMLGYVSQEELVGKSINTIVPFPYSRMHDAFLAKHLNSTTEFIQRQIDIWSMHSSGYAVATRLEVTSEIDQQTGEVVFHGQLYRKRVEKQEFFCVDSHTLNIHFASKGAFAKVLQIPVPDKDGRIGNLKSFMTEEDFADPSFQHLLSCDAEGIMRLNGVNYNVDSKVINKRVPPHLDKPAMEFSIVLFAIDMEMVLAPLSEACSQDLDSLHADEITTKMSKRPPPLSPIPDIDSLEGDSDESPRGRRSSKMTQSPGAVAPDAGSARGSDTSTEAAPGSPEDDELRGANGAVMPDVDAIDQIAERRNTARGTLESEIAGVDKAGAMASGKKGTAPWFSKEKLDDASRINSRSGKRYRIEPEGSGKSIGREGQAQFSRSNTASVKRAMLADSILDPHDDQSHDSASEMASSVGRKRSVYDRVQRGIMRKGKQVHKYQRLTFLSAIVCFGLTLSEWFVRQSAYSTGMEAITQVGNSMKRAFYMVDLAIAVYGLNQGFENNMTLAEAQEFITLMKDDADTLLELHLAVTESDVNDGHEDLTTINSEPTISIFENTRTGFVETSLWLAVHRVITEMAGVLEDIEAEQNDMVAGSISHACGASCQFVINNAPVSIFQASNEASALYAEIAVEELEAVRTYQWMNVIFTSGAFLVFTIFFTLPTIREAYMSFESSCNTLFQVPRGVIKRVLQESQERNSMVRERLREEFDYDFDDGEESHEEGPVPLGAQSIAERSVAEEIERIKRVNELNRDDSDSSLAKHDDSPKQIKVTFSGQREVRVIPAHKARQSRRKQRLRKARRKNMFAFVWLTTLQSAPFLLTLVYVVVIFLFENVSMSQRISLSRMVNAAGNRWVKTQNAMFFIQDGYLDVLKHTVDEDDWSTWHGRSDKKWEFAIGLYEEVLTLDHILTFGNESLGIDPVQDKTSFPKQYSLLFEGACFETCELYPNLSMSKAVTTGLKRGMETFLNDANSSFALLVQLGAATEAEVMAIARSLELDFDGTYANAALEVLFTTQHAIHVLSEALQESMLYFKEHLVSIVDDQINVSRLILIAYWALLIVGSSFVFRRYVRVNRKMQDIQFLLVVFPGSVIEDIPALGNVILLENEKHKR